MVFKATDNAVTAKYTVSLDDETVRIAREAGDGNLSLGLRLLAQQGNTQVEKRKPSAAVSHRAQKLKELGLVERDGALYFKDGSRPSLTFKKQHGLY